MSKKNDGGPVYPQCGPLDDEPGWIRGGMSLRDWFAGQAPPMDQEWLRSYFYGRDPLPSDIPYAISKWNYEYADAMLAERDKEATHD